MNFHPLMVHFPIAFWSIYSLMEMARLKIVSRVPFWFYLKASLLLIGTGSSYVTYLSGLQIEAFFISDVVAFHKLFATLTILIFTALSINYILVWIEKDFYSFVKMNAIASSLFKLNRLFFHSWLVFLLALAGLVLITITGALGGMIAFGPDIDPITKVIYTWFFE